VVKIGCHLNHTSVHYAIKLAPKANFNKFGAVSNGIAREMERGEPARVAIRRGRR